MRRILVPLRVLAWAEVDLDTETITDLRLCDYEENFEAWPADTDPVDDPERDGVRHARGLCNLSDFDMETRDMATDEESITAGRALIDKTWPQLRIEDSVRFSEV